MTVGFLFDPNRCTGCAACSLACSTENGLGWGVSWRQIVPFNPERHPSVPSFHLSLACNHCDDAPCVAHCPTGAMRRDPATGAVVVDEARCIGCRYCAWVCPYDAPRFDGERGVMTKCTLCNHRLREGGRPACVESCPTDALGYGPLVGEARMPGFPDTSAGPRIRFTPLRRGATPPESTWSLPAEALAAFGASPDAPTHAPTSLTFRGEWPLWLFTSGLAALAGWVAAAAWGAVRLPLALWMPLAGAFLAVSTLHLGRPLRAWRAPRNVRTSALSREVAGAGAFLAATTLWLAWGGGGGAPLVPGAPDPGTLTLLGWGSATLGLLALFWVDRVYDPVRPPSGRPIHSGDALLAGATFGAALIEAHAPFLALSVVRLALYLRRHRLVDPSRVGSPGLPIPSVWAALRLVGLSLPPTLWLLAPDAWAGWAIAAVVGGDLIDRAELYREIGIPTPRDQAMRDLSGWGGR